MADLTAVEQWDAVHEIGALEPVQGGPGGNDNAPHQQLLNRIEFLRKRVGVQGSWDMTGVSAPCEPDGTKNLEASSSKTNDDVYLMTPAAGASQFKMVGAGNAAKITTGLQYARIKTPASGGNLNISGITLANPGATQADISAALFAGTPVGTCTHFAAVFIDHGAIMGAGANKIMYLSLGTAGATAPAMLAAAGSVVATDQLYVSLNMATGQVAIKINAGAPIAAPTVWDFSGLTAVRPSVLTYFGSTTPTLVDGTVDFDLGDSTGSKTAFTSVIDPTPPAGAADGKRYLVSVAGSFGGRATSIGDIVEFHTTTTKIQVTPASYLLAADIDPLIAAYIAANPMLTLLQEARMKSTLISVADDQPTGMGEPWQRGYGVIVGSAPSGAFLTFTFGNVAVYDGAAWVEYPASNFEGVHFVFRDTANTYHRGAVWNGYMTINATDINDGSAVNGFALTGLRALGWQFPPIRNGRPVTAPLINLTASGSDQINLGSAEHFTALASSAGNYEITFANAGIATVEINAGANGVVVNVPALGYSLTLNNGSAIIGVSDGRAWVLFENHGTSIWVAPTLLNSWADIGGTAQPAQYRRRGDKVYVRMAVENGTAAPIFTLPAGLRPPYDISFPGQVHDNTSAPDFGHIRVLQNGSVELEHPGSLSSHKLWASFSFDVS